MREKRGTARPVMSPLRQHALPNLAANAVYRRRTSSFLTAAAIAFGSAASTTNCRARVIAV